MPWFDHNATAPMSPEALRAFLDATENFWQNPSSPTAPSARAHAKLEECRARIASIFDGSDAESVVFNSGATEGNNAVLAAEALRSGSGRLLVSAVEHPSVLEPARRHWRDRLTVLPVDREGRLDLNALEAELKKGGVTLVSVMAANNETGVLQPWLPAARLAAAHGARTHGDATQWLGRLPADGLAQLDYVTAGGHKSGAPKGVGLLLVRRCNRDFSGQLGGGQEHGRRAGTENFPRYRGACRRARGRRGRIVPGDGGTPCVALRLRGRRRRRHPGRDDRRRRRRTALEYRIRSSTAPREHALGRPARPPRFSDFHRFRLRRRFRRGRTLARPRRDGILRRRSPAHRARQFRTVHDRRRLVGARSPTPSSKSPGSSTPTPETRG